MGRRVSKFEPQVSDPITLADLRWLVDECEGLADDTRVEAKGRESVSPVENYPATITVLGVRATT